LVGTFQVKIPVSIIFDRFGDIVGFVVETCSERHAFRSRKKAIGDLVQRVCRERLLLSVMSSVTAIIRC
jgi:hypothetical protein